MSFNPTKCTVIRIAPRCRKIIDTTYSLHGHTLEVVVHSKYLGVTITESLTWEKHIGNITSNASRTLGFIRRKLRECMPPVKEASYKAMVRPKLENATTVWDPYQLTHVNTIEQVQRQAARFVFNEYSTKTPGCISNMLKELNWDPLEQPTSTQTSSSKAATRINELSISNIINVS